MAGETTNDLEVESSRNRRDNRYTTGADRVILECGEEGRNGGDG